MPVEHVRSARFLFGCRTCRDDAQIAIDLHGVGIDDGAIEPLGKRQRQRRLAARGRPCNKHRINMTHVATLIAPDGALDNSVVDRARKALGQTDAPVWRAPATAVDVPFQAAKAGRTIAEELRALLGGLDVVVQAAQNRRKRLFLADMDSTMIGQECIDELADFAGLKLKIAAITERA